MVAMKESATDRAMVMLRERITSGAFTPGERIPAERDLAAELGLSRGSVREGIRALIVLGMLEARRGAGVYVTGLKPADLLEDAFGTMIEIADGATLVHLLSVRKILESAATAAAAARLSDGELALLGAELDAMRATDDVERFVTHDQAFHRIISESADNPVLSTLLANLNSRTFRASVRRGRDDAAALPRTRAEHERIYLALRDRDPDAARAAAAVHLASVEHWARGNR